MKRIIAAMMTMAALLLGGLTAYADIGIPEGTRQQAVIKPGGADYYLNVDGDNPESAGRLDGGTAFYYVMGSSVNGYHYGTTDVNAADGEAGKFMYVSTEDITYPTEEVFGEIGDRTNHTQAVTTDELNLRTGPGTGYEVKEVLPKDTKVEYDYTFKTDTTWMYVSVNDMSGWVSGDYLKTVSVETVEETTTSEETTTVEKSDEKTDASPSAIGRGIFPLIAICIIASAVVASLVTYLLLKNKSKEEKREQ